MIMTKKKVTLKNLGKQHVKDALVRVHPFLRNEYRTLKADELDSKEVHKELFPSDKIVELYKLKAVYVYQN